MDSCNFCGGKNIEKFSENHYLCRDCGFGTDGKAKWKNFSEHIEFLKKSVILAKKMFPTLTNEQLADKIQKTLHKVESHPLRRDGFCEYCNVKYEVVKNE